MWVAAIAGLLALLGPAACGGGATSAADAEAMLARIVLPASAVGDGYSEEQAQTLTNEEVARARPDTATALEQYDAWGQVLQYNAQFAAPAEAAVVFTAKVARVMNTATLFEKQDGASDALAYLRELPPDVVADFLVNEGAGTQVSDTHVERGIDLPQAGDESFAWRISGTAAFDGGVTVNFVADSVFVRVGRVNGNVTAISLGQAPPRDQLLALVEEFVTRARREQA